MLQCWVCAPLHGETLGAEQRRPLYVACALSNVPQPSGLCGALYLVRFTCLEGDKVWLMPRNTCS